MEDKRSEISKESQILSLSKEVLIYYIINGVKTNSENKIKLRKNSKKENEDNYTDNSDYEDNNENIILLNSNNENNELLNLKKEIKKIETKDFKYIGEMVNNKKEGFGICEYFNDNSKYEGLYKKGKKLGYGKTTMSDGTINIGEIEDNTYNGYCESYNPKFKVTVKGLVFKGRFIDEVFITVDDKTLIEGLKLSDLYYNNEDESIDTTISNYLQLCHISYSDNKFFIGEVDCSTKELKNAFGLSVYKGQHAYFGNIKDLKMEGYGELYFIDSSRFYGTFRENKKHGFGISIFNDKSFMIGKYEKDYKTGPFLQFSRNLIKMELYFEGFKTKSLEKFDTIKKYISKNYPEFVFILDSQLKRLAEKYCELKDIEFILSQLIKLKEETEPKEENNKKSKGTPKFKCKVDNA